MSDELLIALENERRYVAQELHDGVAQTALQLGLQVGICLKLLEHERLDMLAGELAQLEERIQVASGQVRAMIADMRPPQVEAEAGLGEYLQLLISIHVERGGPPVEVQNNWSEAQPALTEPQQLALVRVVQEALQNVRKHAQAQKVDLTLTADERNYHLIISDDGQGFEPEEVAARPTDRGGAGLANLRARVEAIGGSLALGQKATGEGAIITVSLARQEADHLDGQS